MGEPNFDRLLWNFVSAVRTLAQSDAKNTPIGPAIDQTQDAIDELVGALLKASPGGTKDAG